MDNIKEILSNVKLTPQLVFEVLLLLSIIASGGWLFLLLITAVHPHQPQYKYEIEVLSQILDGIFTYVCLINSLPRLKMFISINQIIQMIDNSDNTIEWYIKLDTFCKPFIADYAFLLPTLPNTDIEVNNNPIINNKSKDINPSSEYIIYLNKTRHGLVILRKVAILLNLNWVFQIPITTIMLWYASIIPCENHCAFDNRPPEVIAVFLPLSFSCAAGAAYILIKNKMSS